MYDLYVPPLLKINILSVVPFISNTVLFAAVKLGERLPIPTLPLAVTNRAFE